MRQVRTREEIKAIVLEHGHKAIAIMELDPKGKKGELKPVPIGDISLHELIEYIHLTGNVSGRHLSGGERQALIDGIPVDELS